MTREPNPFLSEGISKQLDIIKDSDAYDAIWDPINTKIDNLFDDFRKVLVQIRATQNVPVNNVQFSIYECSVLKRSLENVRTLREIDINDLRGRHNHVSRSFSYLNDIAIRFRRPTAEEIKGIIQGQQPSQNLLDRVKQYELEVWLILLAKPEGKDFWDLLRTTWQRLQSERDVEDRKARSAIDDLERILHWIAPAKFFNDKAKYYPSNRYGHRTKNVEWIVPAGLPGLGKRA